MRKKLVISASAGALLLVGIVAAACDDSSSSAPAASPAATEQPAAETTTPVPDLANLRGDEARQKLLDLRLVADLKSDDGSVVMMAGNWVVASTDPVAGTAVAPGATVTVNVARPPADPAAEAAARQITASSAPLLANDVVSQRVAAAGYRWNGDPIIGVMASTQQADGSWFVKYTGTVRNAAGGRISVVVEANVSGDTDNPVVTNILVYGDGFQL